MIPNRLLYHVAATSSAISGCIQLALDPTKCLEIQDPLELSSNVVVAKCSLINSHQWTNNPELWQIALTARPNKCLQVHHPANDNSDEFARDPLEVMPCRYTGKPQKGLPFEKGNPEGFQKLVFVNHTIVWRGQSKVLPSAVTRRYCLEISSTALGSPVYLQYCQEGKGSQQFSFLTDRGDQGGQSWSDVRVANPQRAQLLQDSNMRIGDKGEAGKENG